MKTNNTILKWVGGKSQMLKDILPNIPLNYGKYIEPFIGGGAVFFELNKKGSIIADSNPELINLYREVAVNCDNVIKILKTYNNTEESFYYIRSMDWTKCEPEQAAARMIYLNRTCFNGLYRVNKNGQFNVPYGRYKNPSICNEQTIRNAADLLKDTTIVQGDFLEVLSNYSSQGDLIFLDPPYIPISEYSDFKRYTKEQFHVDDHRRLANEVRRLYDLGCYVILTNSNHPLVHELYADFKINIIPTKRNISCKGDKRTGEDVIITAFPRTGSI